MVTRVGITAHGLLIDCVRELVPRRSGDSMSFMAEHHCRTVQGVDVAHAGELISGQVP